jgi:hypothetical protein
MTGHDERTSGDEGLVADMALLDELLDTLARHEQPLSEEDLERALGLPDVQPPRW